MNTAQISAWFEANKKPVLAVAGVGAVGLGLMKARKAHATGGGEPTPGPYNSSAGSAFAPAPAFTGTMPAPFDSSAYDSYNDLQNQIIRMNDQLEAQKAPLPVPEYQEGGFYAQAGGGKGAAIYQYRDGKLDWLENNKTFRQLGGSLDKINYVSKDDGLWKAPRVDPPKK